jgi:hypothetical protein
LDLGEPMVPAADAGSVIDVVAHQFDEFWAAYPRKQGKGEVRDLFCKIVTGKHKTRRASAATLIEAAKRYAASRLGQEPQYTKMPATWLNQGCWEDDLDDQSQRRSKYHGI